MRGSLERVMQTYSLLMLRMSGVTDVASEVMRLASSGLLGLLANDRRVAPAVAGLGTESTPKILTLSPCAVGSHILEARHEVELLVGWLVGGLRLLGCQTSVVLTSLPVHWTLIAI